MQEWEDQWWNKQRTGMIEVETILNADLIELRTIWNSKKGILFNTYKELGELSNQKLGMIDTWKDKEGSRGEEL